DQIDCRSSRLADRLASGDALSPLYFCVSSFEASCDWIGHCLSRLSFCSSDHAFSLIFIFYTNGRLRSAPPRHSRSATQCVRICAWPRMGCRRSARYWTRTRLRLRLRLRLKGIYLAWASLSSFIFFSFLSCISSFYPLLVPLV